MLRLAPLMALLFVGCANRDLDWEIAFETTTLEDQTTRLDARILRGACPGTDQLWAGTVHPGSSASDPPTLAEGTYCLAADAGGVSCEWVGHGEQTVALPTDATVVVMVMMEAGGSNCPVELCNADGTCGSGGSPVLICAAGDCNQTCTSDCTASCSGGGCNQTCLNAADCDFTCSGGGCDVLCEDAADCISSCSGGSCDQTCNGVGSDCIFSCPGMGCVFMCSDLDDCTTSCPSDCVGP